MRPSWKKKIYSVIVTLASLGVILILVGWIFGQIYGEMFGVIGGILATAGAISLSGGVAGCIEELCKSAGKLKAVGGGVLGAFLRWGATFVGTLVGAITGGAVEMFLGTLGEGLLGGFIGALAGGIGGNGVSAGVRKWEKRTEEEGKRRDEETLRDIEGLYNSITTYIQNINLPTENLSNNILRAKTLGIDTTSYEEETKEINNKLSILKKELTRINLHTPGLDYLKIKSELDKLLRRAEGLKARHEVLVEKVEMEVLLGERMVNWLLEKGVAKRREELKPEVLSNIINFYRKLEENYEDYIAITENISKIKARIEEVGHAPISPSNLNKLKRQLRELEKLQKERKAKIEELEEKAVERIEKILNVALLSPKNEECDQKIFDKRTKKGIDDGRKEDGKRPVNEGGI